MQLKDQALQQPLRDSPAAYRAIREMLAKGTSDPYTRFITPEEFESMRKYDVTGVGLHLGTAEEFVKKTGLQLPPGHQESEVSGSCLVTGSCLHVYCLIQSCCCAPTYVSKHAASLRHYAASLSCITVLQHYACLCIA